MTSVKQYINEAQKRMHHDHGYYIPPKHQPYTFQDAGISVTLHGPSLGAGPVADYEGPEGTFQAFFTLRGCGKTWRLSAT